MALDEPVLCKRIPTHPWGDPADRRTVGYDEYVRTGGYQALKQAVDMEPKQVVDTVKSAEVRGRGGAGFNAGLKWSFMPEPDGDRRYVVVNFDESEPGTFKDRILADCDPHLCLEGFAICAYANNCDTIYIYIRGEYHQQAKTLQKAIEEAYANNVFGENSFVGKVNDRPLHCYLHRGAGAYICGEETGLLESLEGKRGWPRIKPPFPAVKGVFSRPTVINNVETLAMVVPVIENGVEWYRSLGVPSRKAENAPGSFGPKLFGVSGHVNRPGMYEEELGITLKDLVENHCKGMRNGKKFKACIPGGNSTGFLGTDEFDAELDFDIGRYNVLGLGTAGVIVFDEDTNIVSAVRNIVRFFSHESCGQCTPCREGTGWMYQMLCRIEEGEGRTKDLDLLDEIAKSMGALNGTTICGLADGAQWAVKTALAKFRDEFEARCQRSSLQIQHPATAS